MALPFAVGGAPAPWSDLRYFGSHVEAHMLVIDTRRAELGPRRQPPPPDPKKADALQDGETPKDGEGDGKPKRQARRK